MGGGQFADFIVLAALELLIEKVVDILGCKFGGVGSVLAQFNRLLTKIFSLI